MGTLVKIFFWLSLFSIKQGNTSLSVHDDDDASRWYHPLEAYDDEDHHQLTWQEIGQLFCWDCFSFLKKRS